MPSGLVSPDNQLRILRVAQTVYPDVKGGGAYHVHALSRDQAAMGHDVTVLTVRKDPAAPHIEERSGYTLVRYDPSACPLGNQISIGVAQYLRAANSFDVIHAHSHLYFSTNLAALKRWIGDTPLAITNHGLYSQTAPERTFEWYLKTVGRWTLNQADTVFCYTDIDRQRLRELGIQADIEVVPNGIDTARFTAEGPESKLIEADGPVVLFVGRLVDGKRPQDALEAMKYVRETHPDATLYFCGEGPLRDELETQFSAESGDDVVFLGHVPYSEMPRIHRSADVLLLPSRAEGMPRTVLEAIASGTDVVCSDLKQVSSIVRANDSVVPVGDVQAFADAIQYQLSHATEDHSLSNSDYEWQRTVNSVTETLRQLTRE